MAAGRRGVGTGPPTVVLLLGRGRVGGEVAGPVRAAASSGSRGSEGGRAASTRAAGAQQRPQRDRTAPLGGARRWAGLGAGRDLALGRTRRWAALGRTWRCAGWALRRTWRCAGLGAGRGSALGRTWRWAGLALGGTWRWAGLGAGRGSALALCGAWRWARRWAGLGAGRGSALPDLALGRLGAGRDLAPSPWCWAGLAF